LVSRRRAGGVGAGERPGVIAPDLWVFELDHQLALGPVILQYEIIFIHISCGFHNARPE
jgi:hypothetical protein